MDFSCEMQNEFIVLFLSVFIKFLSLFMSLSQSHVKPQSLFLKSHHFLILSLHLLDLIDYTNNRILVYIVERKTKRKILSHTHCKN
jgi:hypothetical protein